jgi:hypothetical protein
MGLSDTQFKTGAHYYFSFLPAFSAFSPRLQVSIPGKTPDCL